MPGTEGSPGFRRQWRYYRTASGAAPVREYLADMEPADRARVQLAMLAVTHDGRAAARHLRGDIYEVRAGRGGRAWRVLFSAEGRFDHILLALCVFEKKSQQAPRPAVDWLSPASRTGTSGGARGERYPCKRRSSCGAPYR